MNYPEKARTGHSGKVGLLGREGLAGISAKNGRGGVTNPPSSVIAAKKITQSEDNYVIVSLKQPTSNLLRPETLD